MSTETPPPEPRLGIDIGRVIIDGPAHPGGDTAFFSGDERLFVDAVRELIVRPVATAALAAAS